MEILGTNFEKIWVKNGNCTNIVEENWCKNNVNCEFLKNVNFPAPLEKKLLVL